MDVVLLHNEKAGNESWSRKELTRLVEDAGYRPRYHPLALALDQPRVLERGEFVIVAGGDGAIRKVALALLGKKIPLAPLPLGTANNIVRSFNLPLAPEKIIEGWKKPQRRRFDVGVIEGPWGRRHFIEGVGIGLISRSIAVIEHIDALADYELKKAKHRLHRDLCVAAALAHEMHPLAAKVNYDGRKLEDEFLLLEILNIRRAGPGMELAPHASPSDGRFDVVSATLDQRARLVRIFDDRLMDHDGSPSLSTRRARRVGIKLRNRCVMRIDDETVTLETDTTLQISMRETGLEFILPKAGK